MVRRKFHFRLIKFDYEISKLKMQKILVFLDVFTNLNELISDKITKQLLRNQIAFPINIIFYLFLYFFKKKIMIKFATLTILEATIRERFSLSKNLIKSKM